MRVCPSCKAVSIPSIKVGLLPVRCPECSATISPVGLIDLLYNLLGVLLAVAVTTWGLIGKDNTAFIFIPALIVVHFLLRGILLPLEVKPTQ